MESINTNLDSATIQQLDDWRSNQDSDISRSEAVKILLKESLCLQSVETIQHGHRIKLHYPHPETLGAIYVLEQVYGFGPIKFRLMVEAGLKPQDALEDPKLLPFPGAAGARIRNGIDSLPRSAIVRCMSRAYQQIEIARSLDAHILVIGDSTYPQQVYKYHPIPVLYVRGDPTILRESRTTAVVGSRNIRDPYTSQTRQLAATLAEVGRVHISGFAQGADTIGHKAAINYGGKTVCVMPCGLDRLFPPENRELWQKLLQHPYAVFVSEFGFGQGASALRLRKRNKLIVALAQEVFIAQSALDGGAMNAYRFSCEQKKPVGTFRSDSTTETEGNALIESDYDNTVRGGTTFELDERVSHHVKCNKQVSSSI